MNSYILLMCLELEDFAPGITKVVRRYSKHYSHGAVEKEDLEQEAWLAMLAIKDRIKSLPKEERTAFCVPFVRRAVLDYSLTNRRIVRFICTRDSRKAICSLRRDVAITVNSCSSVKIDFAKRIRVSEESLDIAFAYLGTDLSISAEETSFVDATLDSFGIFSNLENSKSDESSRIAFIYSEMDRLSEPERNIISRRWLSDKKVTLQEISNEMNMSVSGVAFVERKAIDKIKVATKMYL